MWYEQFMLPVYNRIRLSAHHISLFEEHTIKIVSGKLKDRVYHTLRVFAVLTIPRRRYRAS